jgi:hypothetical protein
MHGELIKLIDPKMLQKYSSSIEDLRENENMTIHIFICFMLSLNNYQPLVLIQYQMMSQCIHL